MRLQTDTKACVRLIGRSRKSLQRKADYPSGWRLTLAFDLLSSRLFRFHQPVIVNAIPAESVPTAALPCGFGRVLVFYAERSGSNLASILFHQIFQTTRITSGYSRCTRYGRTTVALH